jgi:hypothetical protein
MPEWNGRERRLYSEEGRAGRRQTDQHCHQHGILWQNHDKDKEAFRGITCNKISEVKTNLATEVDRLGKVDEHISTKIDEMNRIVVGKFWFRVVIGSMFAALIYIAGQNRLSNNDQIDALKDIAKNQKEISATVNSIENKQIEMVGQMVVFKMNIDELTRRQDVLRDINIKQRLNDGRDGRDGNMGRDGRDATK